MQNKGSLHTKFENYGATPSDAVWQNIDATLTQKKKKKAIIFWWIGGSIAATVAILFSIKGNSSTQNTLPNVVNYVKEASFPLQKTETSSQGLKNKMINHKQIAVSTVQSVKNTTQQALSNTKKSIIKSNDITESITSTNELQINGDQLMQKRITIHKMFTDLTPIKINFKNQVVVSEFDYKTPKNIFHYSLNFETVKRFPQAQITALSASPDGFLDLSSQENLETITTSPFTINFGVGMNLSKRFEINSSISLGVLRTTTSLTKTDIVYVGLPLNLQFHFIQKRRFNAYTTLGLINEIPFYERHKTALPSESIITKELISGFNGGFNFGLGLGYNLNENIRLNILPNYKYYSKQTVKTNFDYIKSVHNLGFQIGAIWKY